MKEREREYSGTSKPGAGNFATQGKVMFPSVTLGSAEEYFAICRENFRNLAGGAL